MTIWVNQVSSAGIVLSDELVKLKDCEFGNRLGIPENDFNKAASVPLETLADERIKLRQLLSQYKPKNIYNTNKTGLFYQMLPNQTLVQQAVSGQKRDKSQLTVLLATNTTGSHKLMPLIIVLLIVDNARSHSAPEMPASSDNINGNRDKRSENDELDSEYKDDENFISESSENDEISNSEEELIKELAKKRIEVLIGVLMEKLVKVLTEVLMEVLIKELVEELIEGRLTNIKLHYLPPNMTAHLQPLDIGIISEEEMEITNQEFEDDFLDDEIAEIIVDLSSSDDPEASNIAQTMERYVQIVDEPVATEGMLDDEKIITIVQAEENEQKSNDDEEPPPPPIIAKEIYSTIQTVLRYEEQTNSESNLELAELEFL
ncbi:17662_t:CDS:2 [Gigaspora margarita]|uniref:17662_t:CDS:1 n=1 Tax=Gigaspora margarita TaxID=4874 RepID=A0ABN7UME3_GIGMA|nr:17662_t:CDS:2 [Gigaspora margarita]